MGVESFNANNARQLAFNSLQQRFASFIEEIKAAASEGKTSLTIYWNGEEESVVKALEKYLTSLGYTVRPERNYGIEALVVDWGLPKLSYESFSTAKSLLQI